jgi:hypothetical protein
VFRWNICPEDAEEAGNTDDDNDNDDNKEEMDPSSLVGLGTEKVMVGGSRY